MRCLLLSSGLVLLPLLRGASIRVVIVLQVTVVIVAQVVVVRLVVGVLLLRLVVAAATILHARMIDVTATTIGVTATAPEAQMIETAR